MGLQVSAAALWVCVRVCVCNVQETLLKSAWGMLDNKTKTNLENQLDCCGLFDQDVQSCGAVSVTVLVSACLPPPHTHTLTLPSVLCSTAGL